MAIYIHKYYYIKVQGKIKTVLNLKKITLVFRKQSAAKVLFSPKMHFFFESLFDQKYTA